MTTYNTGNPLGSAAAKDLYDNAENIDHLTLDQVNETWPDRLGRDRLTWYGMEEQYKRTLASIGWILVESFQSGATLTLSNQALKDEASGEYYRWDGNLPKTVPPGSTPATAGGVGPEAWVGIGDASLRTMLATSVGSSMIGMASGGTLNQAIAWVTPQQFGAKADGITDDTASLQAWASYTGVTRKHLAAGRYKISAKINFNPGDYIYGDGVSSVIDASSGIGGAYECIGASGEFIQLPGLAQNVTKRFNSLEFTSPPDLKLGDVILIWNPTNKSWSTWRDDYRAGEYCRVASVSGTTVTVYGLTYDGYNASDVQLYKLNGTQTIFKDFVIKQPATGNTGLLVEMIDSPVIENVFASGSLYAGISVQKCVDIDINCHPRQSSTPSGNNYGLAIGNTQGGQVRGYYYGTRHAISLGGAVGIGSVCCRNLDIFASMSNLQPGAIAAQDLHGNTEDIRFHGGTFTNGGIVAGKDIKFIGCTFLGRSGTGIAMFMGEVKGGTFEFIGCRFETVTNPNTSQGIISCQNFTASVVEDCYFVFTGTTIRCPGDTTFPVYFALDGTSARINVSFNGGLTFLAAASLTSVILIRNRQSTGDFGTISMKEVTGLPRNGCAYVNEVGNVTVSKYRLPKQVGTVIVPVTTAGSVFDASVTLPHAHPVSRTPVVITGNSNTQVGGKQIISGYTAANSTGFLARVQSTDNASFSSSGSALVAWVAELDEQ
ncbi:phage tailspike polysaccharide lyase family protein [Dryocola sp. BD613]|uniref:phage tailspike polysaccharide lyase family protein n=1 Tax=Dryocola sp. BD613 TaxID=3133272 RepID=UPI003F503979